ncbi:hypothetical protein ACH5RR_000974 [Cinchona calisaya]|uniref:Uncharacterized protein n=1 Tax=Cinchona calisaya TaxID=153742 RepID=A0ABD3B285_9GENT
MLHLLKPTTLQKAFEIAEVQDQALEVSSSKSKQISKSWGESGQNSRSNNGNWESASKGGVGPLGKNGEKFIEESKKISPQEIQYRRNNNLCFRCGEKTQPRVCL